MQDANSVINLMFLRPNFLELDDYTIHPEFHYLSDYALLIVDISIIKEFILSKQYIIIKNSEKEGKFITNLINIIKKLTLNKLAIKSCLKLLFKILQINQMLFDINIQNTSISLNIPKLGRTRNINLN